MSKRRIWVLGYPGAAGGANTECWHTIKLWRKAGWQVSCIPTWQPGPDWQERLAGIGVQTICTRPEDLAKLPGLAGSVVVAFCNSNFWRVYSRLREIGCCTVWVGCMTFLFPGERQETQKHGPCDAYVFQSQFQRSMLEAELAKLGYRSEQGHLIRGAFDPSEFHFASRPHPQDSQFVVGKLARADLDKWSSNHWPILSGVPYQPLKSLNMGWNRHVQEKLGRPPAWAECLPVAAISTADFLSRCHVLFCENGGARENWPRVGLEAMAAGVPVVAPNRWGWTEMIENGEAGFLTGNDRETQFRLAELAYDEPLRLRMAEAARQRLKELADPQILIAAWDRLFKNLEAVPHEDSRRMCNVSAPALAG